MKKHLKKATALLLVIALVLANGVVAFAATDESPALVPIREFFEESGGAVDWDAPNRRIVATLEDDEFILYPTTTQAFRNGEPVALSNPIVIVNNVAYIQLDDLLRLFGIDTDEPFAITIATAVEIAPVLMEIFSIPGMTIALVDAQTGFTWTQGFGYADSIAGIPVDEHTLFSLASISKPFTAIAVMQLVEQGLIDLDAPIVNYLPEFSLLPDVITGTGDYSNITVRMLMSHASGIHPDIINGMLTTGDYYPAFMDNFLENLAEFAMVVPESFQLSYANNAFTLLGILVAAVATDYDSFFEGFVSYTQENIFERAGMDLSTFALTDRHWPYVAQGYAHIGAQEDFVFINPLPTGGLMSNAYDMARFMHIILNDGAIPGGGRLLSASSVRQMLTPQRFELGSPFDFMLPNMQPGLGFVHSTGMTGFTHVGHGGNMIHFHSDMAFDLDSGIGVFVSVNSITGMPLPADLSTFILMTAVEEKTGTLDEPESDLTVEPIEVDLEVLQALEGFFSLTSNSEFVQVVASEEGHLYLYGMAPTALIFIPLSDGSFVFPDTGLRLWFEDVDGELVFYFGEFKSLLVGSQLNTELITAQEGFERWVGVYYAYTAPGHLFNLYRAEIGIDENGFAYMRVSTLNGLNLISPLIALDECNFLGGVTFSQDDDGTWMLISGGRFLRVE